MFEQVRKMRGASKSEKRVRSGTDVSQELMETWKEYSYTVGDDIEKKQTKDAKKGKDCELWFVEKGPKKLKKVFVSFKVKRVSDIDNVKEQVCIVLKK